MTTPTIELVKKLASEKWSSILVDTLSIDYWITLAAHLCGCNYLDIHPDKPADMMVARVQILLVDGDLLSDEQFVLLLTRKIKDLEIKPYVIQPIKSQVER